MMIPRTNRIAWKPPKDLCRLGPGRRPGFFFVSNCSRAKPRVARSHLASTRGVSQVFLASKTLRTAKSRKFVKLGLNPVLSCATNRYLRRQLTRMNMTIEKYGYARVSSRDQDLSIQEATLKAAGCRIIRMEKASGTSRKGRPELELLLEFMREGDELVVTRIDRLPRSISDLQDIVRTLKTRGVILRVAEQPIDTSTASGKCFFDMLGVFAEFETNLRKERQLEGIAKAKSAGVYKGRKRKVPIDEVKQF